MIVIYKITCIGDNRVYIGQTNDFERRVRGHKSYLRHNMHNERLQESYNKYGLDSFRFEIIEECQQREEADEKEHYWIKFFETYNHKKGFNIERGGNKGKKIPQEVIDKIRTKKIGRKLTEEHKQKISKSLKGKKRSKEVCEKLKEARRNNPLSDEARKRISTALKGNKHCVGRKYSKETLNKMSKSAKNRKYTEEGRKKISESRKRHPSNNRSPITAINIKTLEETHFNSIAEMIKTVDAIKSKDAIYACLKGERESYNGYKFRKTEK